MSDQVKSKLRHALDSRDREISAALERLYATFNNSDASSPPSTREIAAAASALRDNYATVAHAVAHTGSRLPGTNKLAGGLAGYSVAFDHLARGLRTSDPAAGDRALDQMDALLKSAEADVSDALNRLRL